MKNILLYYSAILAPILILVVLPQNGVGSNIFVLSMLFYVFIYRTITDGSRLFAKGLIRKEDIWKSVLAGYHFKYFKQLYFR